MCSRTLIFLLIIILSSLASVSQEKNLDPHSFLVVLSEGQIDLGLSAVPSNLTNCARIEPTGRYYIVLKREEVMGMRPTVIAYEGRLSTTEISILRKILDADNVRNLPAFVPPPTPLHSKAFEIFGAQIARESRVQKVGYFGWQGNPPHNADELKKGWEDARITLQELADWFHALRSYNYPSKRKIVLSKAPTVTCDFQNSR